MLIGLLACAAPGAVASGSNLDYVPNTSFEQLEDGLDSGVPNVADARKTNFNAAQELPRKDLNRAQALELMRSVFWPSLQSPAGIFDELDGARLLSTHVAVIDTTDSPGPTQVGEDSAILVESALPLSTDESTDATNVVNLDLESSEGEIQPSNPLVEVGIPTKLSDGIRLPEQQVTINLPNTAGERSPTTVAQSTAFYPNIARDSDLVVAPTPTGMETFTQLRSPDAPHQLPFELTLPNQATLQRTPDGGAEVQRNGDRTIRIPPPIAIDAQGRDVPVELSVDGSTLTLDVSPDVHTTYPLLVDPLYETFDWDQSVYDEFGYHPGWIKETNNDNVYYLSFQMHTPLWGSPDALAIQSADPSESLAPGNRASWQYFVPKYFSDYEKYGVRPTTYIDHVSVKELMFRFVPHGGYAPSRQYSPYFVGGIYDRINDGFVSIAVRSGVDGELTDPGYQYEFHNPNQNVNAKDFGLYLSSNQSIGSVERYLWAGYKVVTLSDKDKPAYGMLSAPNAWMNEQPVGPINFTVTDPGLGIARINIANPRAAMKPLVTINPQGCVGGTEQPCPRTWSSTDLPAPNLVYNPQVMPQGENWVTVNAHDAAGRTSSEGGSPTQARIKVDHTPPELDLSGSLPAHAELGTHSPTYNLNYTASDGYSEPAAALTPFGFSGSGTGATQRPIGVAADGKGNVWIADRENSRIVQFDESGSFIRQFGSHGSQAGQFNEPRDIAIMPDGSLWVSEWGGNRLQKFSPAGQLLKTVPLSTFGDPYALAADPVGNLWVSDSAKGRVVLLQETAEGLSYVRELIGSASSSTGKANLQSPVGLATDPSGNVWVANSVSNLVQAYDVNGQFQMEFGSAGSGNGQFNGPWAIEISPSGNLLVVDGGNNRIQEFEPSGGYIRQFGMSGTGSDRLSEPRGLAFGAGNRLFVSDAGNHRVTRWSGADTDPQSGAVSTEVKIDGVPVEPKYSPGCSTRNCSITRDWTVDASDYDSGQHKVEVTATDGVGLSTTKELTLTTDSKPPALEAMSSFFTMPKGWVEQKTYPYSLTLSDSGGYGVTSLVLKLDGQVVGSTAQACPGGDCSATLAGSINTAAYAGGAHSVELVASDGAGNSKTFTSTINVDPKGTIPADEAVDTLDAVDATSESSLVASTDDVVDQAEQEAGNDPGLKASSTHLESTGTTNPSTIAVDPSEGFEIESPGGNIHVEPVAAGDELTPVASASGAAAVSANSDEHVDSIIRPVFTGIFDYRSIRDASAPEAYSWEVHLEEDQTLRLVSSEYIAVEYPGERIAYGITAEPAHDAVGTTVPTQLSLTAPNVITLTVEHNSSPYVYPVIGGAGWQGGFQTAVVETPPPEELSEEEAEEGLEPGPMIVNIGAPEPIGSGESEGASTSGAFGLIRTFGFATCSFTSCGFWEVRIRGFFLYNYKKAWYPENRNPKCPTHAIPTYDIDIERCQWVGPNNQQYGNGYHVTAQGFFDVSYSIFTREYPITVRAFGSGGVYAHRTKSVCNPSRPGC